MSKVFQRTAPARVGRSVFNLSHSKKLTCDMGQLIPVCAVEMVPGDVFDISVEAVIRLQPLVAPLLHEVNAYFHYFFVPYRLLWDDWEDFITGGEDGTSAPTIPVWTPTDYAVGSLWDYMGMPTMLPASNAQPVDFPKRAYNLIYNEYYRDQTLVTELDITTAEDVQLRAWAKDYFTGALPWQQRGTAPALPISGVLDIDGKDSDITVKNENDANPFNVYINHTGADVVLTSSPSASGDMRWVDPALEVDLSAGVTFDVSDLRLAFQVQKWLERNARAGSRYKEQLLAHFGNTGFNDARLDRPEFIGGAKSPVIFSEVLQTESSDASTAQGTMAGHGISVQARRIGKCRAPEFGVLIGIMSVMPRAQYQQGVHKTWLSRTKYDYYFPEFANLSEQPVYRSEILASGTPATNEIVFGYIGRYDHLRVMQDQTCGEMRVGHTYDYWHMGRYFSSGPTLNQTFIETGDIRKDVFAAPSEPGLIVSVGNRIRAVRPLPIVANPGLIDH